MLKGMGISSIVKLVLAVMIASLFISITTIGALGGALQESFEEIGQTTDFTTEIENVEELSHLTLFVRDRAINEGCDVVEEVNNEEIDSEHYLSNVNDGGYPGLEGSHLTRYPSCFGGESGLIREGVGGLKPGPDGAWLGGPDLDENHMPGIFSRERFEVVGNMDNPTDMDHLQLNTANSDIWLEHDDEGILIPHDSRVSEIGDAIRAAEEEDDDGGLLTGGSIIGAIGAIATRTCPKCAVVGAVLYAGGDAIYHATLADSETEVARPQVFFAADNVNLEDRTNINDIDNLIDDDADRDEIEDLSNDLTTIVQFCPGDEGYIQGSRGYPDDDSSLGEEPLYPIIVINRAEQDTCGEWAENKDYSGHSAAEQLYIHSAAGDKRVMGPSAVWPESYEFRLRDEDEMETWKAELEPEWDRCQIYYRQRRRGVANREFVTVRSYSLGTIVDQKQETFRHDDGDGLFFKIESDHRGGSAQAWDLLEAMSQETGGTGLNNETIVGEDKVGELRVATTGNYGYNRLHGDLLCASPDTSTPGKWHVCYDGLGNKEPLPDFECNPDTGKWQQQ